MKKKIDNFFNFILKLTKIQAIFSNEFLKNS